MSNEIRPDAFQDRFRLDKWFLDFIGTDGQAMIFYVAQLQWRGWTVPYTSWLESDVVSGVRQKTRLRNVCIPEEAGGLIHWSDDKFGVQGQWKTLASPIEARLFDSDEGYLDWKCFQPASKVTLQKNDTVLEGRGYVEKLILTAPPWKIPMNELRWGRFGSTEDQMVWIELKAQKRQKWLWFNGEQIEDCIIEDDHISLPDQKILLELDRNVTLESEKKILSVVAKLISYLPGFKNVIPIQFLLADECKWLSNGVLHKGHDKTVRGMAIHELVNFKPKFS